MQDANMEPVDTHRVSATVTDAGVGLDSKWQGHKGTIAGQEPAIGTGRLGQAFLPRYQKAGTQVRQTADRVPVIFQGLGNAGTGSAHDYETGDGNSEAGMPRGAR